MWICPNCQRQNASQFDLCVGCGASSIGRIDPLLSGVGRGRRRVVRLLVLLPLLYVTSYFLLGSHDSGIYFGQYGSMAKQYTYHDRGFPFDPWVYQPIAKAEYWIRGKDSQVLIKDGTFRGGEPVYGYGPFE